MHVCIEISAQNNRDFFFIFIGFQVKNDLQYYTIFKHTLKCLFISYFCSFYSLQYASLFFAQRQDDPWQAEDCRQDISAEPLAAAWSCHQVSSCLSGQCRDGWMPEGTGRSQRQAQPQEEQGNGHPSEHSLILTEASSTGRLSFYCLTLEEKGAEKQLCPRLPHLYRENTWMEAVCPPHQTPNSV